MCNFRSAVHCYKSSLDVDIYITGMLESAVQTICSCSQKNADTVGVVAFIKSSEERLSYCRIEKNRSIINSISSILNLQAPAKPAGPFKHSVLPCRRKNLASNENFLKKISK